MPERVRGFALLLLALALAAPALAEPDCVTGDWADEPLAAQGGDSGLGGSGASGDGSGLGGSGLSGDDSGLGGTGIFGTITSMGSICVNGERVHFSQDVELVFENAVAIGPEGLSVGQTVWLVARSASGGLFTQEIWVLPSDISSTRASAWLGERIQQAGPLARLSLEGPAGAWIDGRRFAVHGVVVDAPSTTRDVRGAVDSAARVRVKGALLRDGAIRADRISVRPKPPARRPVRPPARPIPPRIDRPRSPERPETILRPELRPVPPKP